MNAREIMQALLDGKIVRSPLGISYKLSDDKLMLKCDDGEWNASHGSFNDSAMQIVEEYPLTFEEALKEMLNGKKVENDWSFEYYRFFDGTFKCYHYEFESEWHDAELSITFQRAKWKVVE